MALDTVTHKLYVAAAKPAPGGGRANRSGLVSRARVRPKIDGRRITVLQSDPPMSRSETLTRSIGAAWLVVSVGSGCGLCTDARAHPWARQSRARSRQIARSPRPVCNGPSTSPALPLRASVPSGTRPRSREGHAKVFDRRHAADRARGQAASASGRRHRHGRSH